MRLVTLGRLDFTLDNGKINSLKYLCLLTYLAIEQKEAYLREDIAYLLWPENDSGKSLHSLTQALSYLKPLLPHSLSYSRKKIMNLPLASDFSDFVAMNEKKNLEGMLSLYQGSFLKNIELELDASIYSDFIDWVIEKRRYLEGLWLENVLYNHRLSVSEKADWIAKSYDRLDRNILEEKELRLIHAILLMQGIPLATKISRQALDEGLDLASSPDDARILLYKWANQIENIPFIAPPRILHNLVGHEGIYHEVKAKVLLPQGQMLAIYGLPGVGKTSLILKLIYDEDILQVYDQGIIWIAVGKTPDLFSIYANLLAAVGLNPNEIGSLKTVQERRLRFQSLISLKRMLLVLDDVWELEDIQELVLGGTQHCYILTSRLPKLVVSLDIEQGSILKLSELSKEASLNYLITALPTIAANYLNDLQDLVQVIGGLPLSLYLIAGYLKRAAIGGLNNRIWEALATLKEPDNRISLSQTVLFPQYYPSLEHSLLSLANVIKLSLESVSEEALIDLYRFSVFVAKPHSFSLEAAHYVSLHSPQSIYELLDAGIVEGIGNERLTLHQAIHDYIHVLAPVQKKIMFEAREKILDFYQRHLETHPLDYEFMVMEQENLKRVFSFCVNDATKYQHFTNLLFSLWHLHGHYDYAYRHLSASLEIAKQRAEKTIADIVTLLNLGKLADRTGKTKEGIQWLEEALAISEKLFLNEYLSEIFFRLGGLQINLGNYPLAQKNLDFAYSYAKQFKQIYQLAAILNGQGYLARIRGDFDTAITLFKEAVVYAKEIKHSSTLATLYQNIAGVELDRGNDRIAKNYAEQSLELAQRLGYLSTIGNNKINLSQLEWNSGNKQQGLQLMQEALELFRQLQDSESTAQCLVELASMFFELDDFLTAKEHLTEALSLAKALKYSYLTCQVLLISSKLYLKHDLPSAKQMCLAALSLAQHLQALDLEGLALYAKSQIHVEEKEYAKALKVAKNSKKLLQKVKHKDVPTLKQWIAKLQEVYNT